MSVCGANVGIACQVRVEDAVLAVQFGFLPCSQERHGRHAANQTLILLDPTANLSEVTSAAARGYSELECHASGP